MLAFSPVIKFFSAVSDSNHQGIKASTTDDFLLLEHGKLWELTVALANLKPTTAERTNFFSIISHDVNEDAALINYWNKAVIVDEGNERTKMWLESAFVVKQGDKWVLRQLHSTRTDPQNIPDNVTFVAMHESHNI